jgi:hypothetical protein
MNSNTRSKLTAPVAQALPRAIPIYRALLADGSATVNVVDRRADRDGMDTRTHNVPAAAMVNAIANHTGWTTDEVRSAYNVECSHLSRQSCKCVARGTLRSEYIAVKAGRRA